MTDKPRAYSFPKPVERSEMLQLDLGPNPNLGEEMDLLRNRILHDVCGLRVGPIQTVRHRLQDVFSDGDGRD